jgi:hypothetical protein
MKITKCRVCGNTNLVSCLDIGEQYLSSIFPDSLEYRNKLEKYSLELKLCMKGDTDNHCGLLQLANSYDLSDMYAAYPYTSMSNVSMRKILKDVVDSGVALNNLQSGDLILDIGGNDGTLLSFFKDSDYQLLNIDAAKNIQSSFSSPNLITVHGFFNKQLFDDAVSKKARLIFSIAMFYHLANPVSFCKDVEACMENNGVWIIQMAYLPAMLQTNMYDNIVHEHNGYYGIETLQWVMKQAGLEIFDVVINDVYGGSFCVFIKKRDCTQFKTTDRFNKLLKLEKKVKIFELQTYKDFAHDIKKTKDELQKLVKKIRAKNKTIWIYGASTKGNTIMQYCEFNKADIVAAADCNSFKYGKYIIGCDVPITDEDTMRKAHPDYLFVLPYSFIDAFMTRENELVKSGTQFITPLPHVSIWKGIL